MTVTVVIPDELSDVVVPENASRVFLEAFAIEGYRHERLTAKQVRLLLGHGSRMETERFLADHDALRAISAEEVLADADTAHAARGS